MLSLKNLEKRRAHHLEKRRSRRLEKRSVCQEDPNNKKIEITKEAKL